MNHKLFFDRPFLEKKYIEYACEATTISYFARNYPANFKYEIKQNKTNSKDVDCQFSDKGFTYNSVIVFMCIAGLDDTKLRQKRIISYKVQSRKRLTS